LIKKIIGTITLPEINRYQITMDLSIKLTLFKQLIKEISHSKEVERSGSSVPWQALVIRVIHKAAKVFLARKF
jgi:histone H3/H4